MRAGTDAGPTGVNVIAMLLASSLSFGADCASGCERLLGCLGLSAPVELQTCTATCLATGGPDPAVSALLEQSSCEVIRQALGATLPAAPATSQAPSASAPASAPGTCPDPAAQADRRLYQQLVANRWCGFRFSGGVTTRTYLRIEPSGRVSQSTDSESVHTGRNLDGYGDVTQTWGVYGASSDAQSGCWRLRGTTAEVSGDGQTWQAVNLSIAPNSNGAPILTIDGKEYMQCQ